jgi:hypothetical protein
MTDWLHSVRTDGLPNTLVRCIALRIILLRALHCIALRCITCCALRFITCIHTELNNVNSAACLLLNCIGHVKCITLRSDLCVCFVCSLSAFFSFFWFKDLRWTVNLLDCMRWQNFQTAETCLSIHRHYFACEDNWTFCPSTTCSVYMTDFRTD